jgi:hypothetical protein
MNLHSFFRKDRSRISVWLIALGIIVLRQLSSAATLNVADYGAVGDCREIYVRVTTNSAVMVTTNTFTAGDVGKIVQLFGAGYYASLSTNGGFAGNYHGTPTNHQDLVATILSVSKGTNVTLSRVCGVTASNIRCTYGTQNKKAFDAAIAAAGSNDVIYIPAGNYHLVAPSALDTNYAQASIYHSQPTITLNRGGLTFLGDGTNRTILTGNGAWQQKGMDSAYRGYLFYLAGPLTNFGPLIFDSIRFDGNATRNHSSLFTSYPAIPTDGSGWDVTHHLLISGVTTKDVSYLGFTNCFVTRWHGETIQGISTGTGIADFGNCTFVDGNATVINFNGEHDFHDNIVTDYYQVAEDGQFVLASGVCKIRNNVFSNIYGTTTIALTGASTNIDHPGYIISSNVFNLIAPKYGIAAIGAKNITINSNYFDGGGIVIGAAGQQGTDYNRNYLISNNVFTNAQVAVSFQGYGNNRAEDFLIENNTATVSLGFATAAERAGSWSTNVVIRNNTANRGPWSTWATGQYLIDDVSNDFPPYADADLLPVNAVSYGRGMRHNLYPKSTSARFYLDTATPMQIPEGAILRLTNNVYAATLYPSANLVNPIVMLGGHSATFCWTNGTWQSVSSLIGPSNLRPVGP